MSISILMPTDINLLKFLNDTLVYQLIGDKKQIIGTVNAMISDGDGNLRIPMPFAKKLWNLTLPGYLELPRNPIHCTTVLGYGGRDYQISAFDNIAKMLIEHHSAFLSLQCGGGKTEVAVKLIADFGLKTAVLTDVSLIFPQWVTVLKERTNARVCAIKSASQIDPNVGLPDADVYVFMVTAAGKIDPKWLKSIKFLVVDEATYFMTPEKSWPILNFSPVYTLGLCAEIKRTDGAHKLMPFFFGDQMIRRISTKPFEIYRIDTPYKPTIQNQRYRHGPDWNIVLKSLSENYERNEDILWLCRCHLPHAKIIIGTKRKTQALYLYERLKSMGEDVQKLVGNDNKIQNCRILVGIYSKMGRGVDVKNLAPDWEGDVFDTAIVALDLCNPEQFVGRVFRHGKPVLYHMVDDYSSLRKHYDKECAPWYKSRKGVEKLFKIDRKGEPVI